MVRFPQNYMSKFNNVFLTANNTRQPQFKGNSVNITQRKTVDNSDINEHKLTDVFIPNIPDLPKEATAVIRKNGDSADFNYTPTQCHNDEEEARIFNSALYTVIKEAQKAGIKEIDTDSNNKFASKVGFKESQVNTSDQSQKMLSIKQEAFGKILENIEDVLKSNLDESSSVYEKAKSFKPQIISLSKLSKPVTVGPASDVKVGINDPAMKDTQVTLTKEDGKVFIQNTGTNEQSKVKIFGNDDLNNEKQEIKSGNTLRIGNELYLFKHDKNKDEYELRFLKRDEKGIFEKLFPRGVSQIDFGQGFIGDCYFLAAMKGLSRNQNAAELFAKMIDTTPDGKFKVTFPGFPKESFTVDESELKGIANVRTKHLGIKVLEHAFYKLKERIKWQWIPSKPLPKDKDGWLSGGFSEEALNILTDGKMNIHDTGLKDENKGYLKTFAQEGEANPDFIDETKKVLKKLKEQEDKVIVCAETGVNISPPIGKSWSIAPDHAYTVADINPEKEEVIVINPWNSSSGYRFNYDEFFKYFSTIKSVKLKDSKLSI